MKQFWLACLTVARRDFMAIVATPSFLLFLLAPLLFIGLGVGSALGTRSLATSNNGSDGSKALIIMAADDILRLRAADEHIRRSLPLESQPPPISFQTPAKAADGDYSKQLNANGARLLALAYGSIEKPALLQRSEDSRTAQYLEYLLTETRRESPSSLSGENVVPREIIPFPPKAREGAKFKAAQGTSMGAITVIFMLTLLLATQSISSIAEEKSNKVIEILAAAVPLEGVFLGKLLAMLGIGVLFIAFWGGILLFGGVAASTLLASAPSGTEMPMAIDAATIKDFAPAVGWGSFFALTMAYMLTNFLLYGALFLGVGSLAATTREIQMLSFPITILQMIAYFVPLSAMSGDGSGPFQRFAEIFPLTSPYSMVSRAALEPELGWHFLAIGWQALWVVIVISLSVRLFRRGVLGGSEAWKFWKKNTI